MSLKWIHKVHYTVFFLPINSKTRKLLCPHPASFSSPHLPEIWMGLRNRAEKAVSRFPNTLFNTLVVQNKTNTCIVLLKEIIEKGEWIDSRKDADATS